MGEPIVVEHRGLINWWRARRWGRRNGVRACRHPAGMRDVHHADLGARKVVECRLCGAASFV